MYLHNKYTRWYNNIIQRAEARQLTGYKEQHHIVPKSLGGTNLKENLVNLTAREHFICHWLLTKMLPSPYKEKMIYAAWAMANLKNQHQQRYKITGRIYELLKQEYSKINSAHSRQHPEIQRTTKVENYVPVAAHIVIKFSYYGLCRTVVVMMVFDCVE